MPKGNYAPRLPSNMEHQFSRVPSANISRSTFNRNHTVKTTFDAGNLFGTAKKNVSILILSIIG